MSDHIPPIGSRAARAHRPVPRARATAWLGLVVALVAVGCGSDDQSAGVAPEPTPAVDAVTGDVFELPDDFAPSLDSDGTGTDDPSVGEEPLHDEAGGRAVGEDPAGEGPHGSEEPAGVGADAEPGDDAPGHPLETVVIDTVEVDPEAPPVLDEAAALACANTEFALDALIEASPELGQRFATAAEWAAESGYGPVRSFADRLAAAPTGTMADELVISVLETCAAAGYEL